jgi:hypothetical protein
MPGIRKNAQGRTGGSSAISSVTFNENRSNRKNKKIVEEHDTLLREFSRFKELYTCILTVLNTYLDYFRDADFEELTTVFTEEVYTSLAGLIVTNFGAGLNYQSILSYDAVYDSGLFSHYKENSYKILDGLNRAIILYKENVNQSVHILSLEEKEKILEDMELLTEYLENQKRKMYLFDTRSELLLNPILKPQYALYFTRHGPPVEDVFDTEKLAVIIKELLDNGTLTQEDIFGESSADC